MKSKVCFIVPYFGRFPNLFPLWLNCCRVNKQFSWLIFTDDEGSYNYPDNVRVEYCTLNSLKERFEKLLGADLSLEKPYKLCDYRALYGVLFSDYLSKYSHWGYCDLDIIFGDLSCFINDILLEEYDKISVLGHMSVLKNTFKVNNCFKKCDYLSVLQNPRNRIFDEVRYPLNINSVLEKNGFKVLKEVNNADIDPDYYNFHLYAYFGGNRLNRLPFAPVIFEYDNGKLYKISLIEGKVDIKEIMYVHFQKRYIVAQNVTLTHYLLIPNKIVPYRSIDKQFINECTEDNRTYTINSKISRIKRAIKSRI